MTYTVKMEKSGRIVIPAEIREQLGLEPGKEITIRVDGDNVCIVGSRASVLRRIQEEFARRNIRRSLSKELIRERRVEARQE